MNPTLRTLGAANPPLHAISREAFVPKIAAKTAGEYS